MPSAADFFDFNLLVQRVADELVRRGTQLTARPFSQRDGERPPGAGAPTYLRVWHRAVEEKDPEAWSEGRARLMSTACWSRWSAVARKDTKPKKAKADAPAGQEALMARMGLRRSA
jgi:hypothetical protein